MMRGLIVAALLLGLVLGTYATSDQDLDVAQHDVAVVDGAEQPWYKTGLRRMQTRWGSMSKYQKAGVGIAGGLTALGGAYLGRKYYKRRQQNQRIASYRRQTGYGYGQQHGYGYRAPQKQSFLKRFFTKKNMAIGAASGLAAGGLTYYLKNRKKTPQKSSSQTTQTSNKPSAPVGMPAPMPKYGKYCGPSKALKPSFLQLSGNDGQQTQEDGKEDSPDKPQKPKKQKQKEETEPEKPEKQDKQDKQKEKDEPEKPKEEKQDKQEEEKPEKPEEDKKEDEPEKKDDSADGVDYVCKSYKKCLSDSVGLDATMGSCNCNAVAGLEVVKKNNGCKTEECKRALGELSQWFKCPNKSTQQSSQQSQGALGSLMGQLSKFVK